VLSRCLGALLHDLGYPHPSFGAQGTGIWRWSWLMKSTLTYRDKPAAEAAKYSTQLEIISQPLRATLIQLQFAAP
jgi:hypothetical protein